MMSLWKVPDRATQELMVRYYRAWLAGKSKHAALREAQLALREEIRARWDAVIATGRAFQLRIDEKAE